MPTGPSQSAASHATPGRDLFTRVEWELVARAVSLSRRELEILQCVVDDLKESAIAEALGVSPHTVHTHLERLYRKLGVSGRGAAVVRVFAVFRSISGAAPAQPDGAATTHPEP